MKEQEAWKITFITILHIVAFILVLVSLFYSTGTDIYSVAKDSAIQAKSLYLAIITELFIIGINTYGQKTA